MKNRELVLVGTTLREAKGEGSRREIISKGKMASWPQGRPEQAGSRQLQVSTSGDVSESDLSPSTNIN